MDGPETPKSVFHVCSHHRAKYATRLLAATPKRINSLRFLRGRAHDWWSNCAFPPYAGQASCRIVRDLLVNLQLLRKCIPILLCPVTVCGDGLHWWPTFCAAGTRTLHFSFSHTRARFCLQTSAHVYDVALVFFVIFGRCRSLKGIAREANNHREHQYEKSW